MTMLETERLTIRNFRIDDWEALHEMINQYVSSGLAAYEPNQWPTSAEEIKKVTEWFAGGDSYFAVCLKDEDRFIGFVALNQEQKEREFNLGYIFNFDYHSKGYATEACRAVLNHAFSRLQAQKVVTGTAIANTASVRLLKRLGFKKTSESSDNRSINQSSFEMSRDEWKARYTDYNTIL
jgi:ribosomal-protein-alanine N-acetyltransferase